MDIASGVNVALQNLRCYNEIMDNNSVHDLSDGQLIEDLKAAASHERAATARLLELLAQVDARKLYLRQGYSSLFVYCTRCLHLSEHAAYGRIEAARAARKFPVLLEMLKNGSITLTTICLLSDHVTRENHTGLLTSVQHKSKREVERLVAALRPVPDLPTCIRKLLQATVPRTCPPPEVATQENSCRERPIEPVAPYARRFQLRLYRHP